MIQLMRLFSCDYLLSHFLCIRRKLQHESGKLINLHYSELDGLLDELRCNLNLLPGVLHYFNNVHFLAMQSEQLKRDLETHAICLRSASFYNARERLSAGNSCALVWPECVTY